MVGTTSVTTFVRKREAGKAVATLDAGNVLKGSLALARKTLYWTKDRKPYSGTFA